MTREIVYINVAVSCNAASVKMSQKTLLFALKRREFVIILIQKCRLSTD